MEHKINCSNFFLLFTKGRQEFDPQRVRLHVNLKSVLLKRSQLFLTF